MYIPNVHVYGCTTQHNKVTRPYLSEERLAAIKREIEEIVEEEFERMQDYASDYISGVAADRAEAFLERVLKGDEDAAMALLGDKTGDSRMRTSRVEEDRPWARLGACGLFETNGIELRRQIVDAHAELLKTERIADLESIVDGLSRQIRELEAGL